MAYTPRYLGDVIHKATGGTAIGYIHSFVTEQGTNLLMNGHNIGETAHLLGFEFPHHFTRLFKKNDGHHTFRVSGEISIFAGSPSIDYP